MRGATTIGFGRSQQCRSRNAYVARRATATTSVEHLNQRPHRLLNSEILLDPRSVDVVASIDTYRTVTGYVVTPVVAVIPPELPLEPHEHEVADWFEAPLGFLLDSANQHRRSALFQGRERHYYEIDWNRRRIWGATAAMIVNLSRRLKWS